MNGITLALIPLLPLLAAALTCGLQNGRRAAALAIAVLATPLTAQEPSTASTSRTKQYEELARDVAALEKHYGVLKKVVRLVRPTVVHIEAPKRRGCGQVQDTGPGVIIRFKERFYVLTNRHVVRNADAADIKIKLADGRRITPSRVWGDPGTDVAVMAVGAIQGWDHANTVLAAGRADLCALARPHLIHPHLSLEAAVEFGQDDQVWPVQYLAAKPTPAE